MLLPNFPNIFHTRHLRPAGAESSLCGSDHNAPPVSQVAFRYFLFRCTRTHVASTASTHSLTFQPDQPRGPPTTLTSRHAPPPNLPQDQSKRVNVGLAERVEVAHVDRFVQHLRSHVALGALPRVRSDVHTTRLAVREEEYST